MVGFTLTLQVIKTDSNLKSTEGFLAFMDMKKFYRVFLFETLCF
jgi:hypothetical protein